VTEMEAALIQETLVQLSPSATIFATKPQGTVLALQRLLVMTTCSAQLLIFATVVFAEEAETLVLATTNATEHVANPPDIALIPLERLAQMDYTALLRTLAMDKVTVLALEVHVLQESAELVWNSETAQLVQVLQVLLVQTMASGATATRAVMEEATASVQEVLVVNAVMSQEIPASLAQ